MKVGIYYFSGSGNTKWVSHKMAEFLLSVGHVVDIRSIEEATSPAESDLIILGGPIYAGNVPEKLIRWVLRNIPQTENAKAAVFSTSAGLQKANGIHSLGRKMIYKGYSLRGTFTYVLPRNFYFGNYPPATKEEAIEQFNIVDKSISSDIQQILSGQEVAVKENVLSLDLFAELMSVMTRFMGKSFSVNSSCIKCGKCVNDCPTQNIVLKVKPHFKSRCMLCTRCIHNCPAHAILYKKQSYPQYQIKKFLIETGVK